MSYAARALDLVIATLALTLLAIVISGGFTIAIVSAHSAAKPLLLMLLAIAVRLAMPTELPRFALSRLRLEVPPAVTDALVTFGITRSAAFSVAFLSNLLIPDLQFRPFGMPFHAKKFAEIFAAWDSGWYFDIAKHGYYFNPHGQSSIAFFPLYPMLVRLLAAPFGLTDRAIWISGILVSICAFIAALVALHRYAEWLLGDRDSARRAVLYVAVFPFSLFFTRVYTESLFLLLTVLAIGSAHRDRWWLAGIAGGLAALTRSNGILVAVPLAWFAIADRPDVRTMIRRAAALALVPLGLLIYCAFVYRLTGDPLAWLSAQRYWDYSVGNMPWRRLLNLASTVERRGLYDFFFTSGFAPYQLIHGVVALVFLALTPAVFARLGAGLGVYTLVSLLVPLSGSDLQGIGRYMSVVFPVFLLAASVRSPRVHEGILVVSSLFLALFLTLFVNWYPIY